MRLLKISLAFVYIWFGILKVFGMSPVKEVVYMATPFIQYIPYGFVGLGIFETVVGIALLFRKTTFIAGLLMAAHLGVTILTILTRGAAWEPVFPHLSLVGEFVFKNFVLGAAALVVAFNAKKQ